MKFLLLISLFFLCLLGFSCKQEKLINPEKSNRHYYSLDKKKILYDSPMSGGDLRVLWKRDYNEIPCDISTFEIFSPLFSKDKDAAYFKYKKIEDANAKTTYYDSINRVLKDKYHVFTMSNIGQCMQIEGAKPETFNYLERDSKKWAKDQFSYFYFNKKLDVDYETFNILNKWFAADKHTLYVSLNNSDSIPIFHKYNSYVKIFNENIAYDNDSIFYIEDKTWPSLMVFPYENINTLTTHNKDNTIISFDGNVYCNGQILPEANPATFEVINRWYSKDAHNVYFNKMRIKKL